MPVSLLHSASPEKRLLIACSRTRLTPGVTEEIRTTLGGVLDWDYLFAEAAENSILPLFDRQLRATSADLLSSSQIERLKTASRANTVRCLYLAAELNRLLDLFEPQGILAIPFKGPALAVQAYGDLALRDFDDLDILLPQRDLPLAHEILLGGGYHPRYPWILSSGVRKTLVPGEYNYRDQGRRIVVELHTELTLRHFPKPPQIDALAVPPATVQLAGRAVRTFSPEINLVLLAIHGAKDFWERLSWIADVSELIQAHPALDWDASFRCSESLGSTRMLHLALALASRLLDAPLPPEIAALVRADRVAESLADQVCRRLLTRRFPGWGPVARFRFRARAIPSSAAGLRYSLRLLTVPAEEDWEMIRLPGALAPLYMALRPFRLLLKHGAAGSRPPGPTSH